MKRLRALLDRTPLRTKLIASVLALVIVALAAISISTSFMLRSYLTTQYDNQLAANFPPALQHASVGYAYPTPTSFIIGVQQPGHQLSWTPEISGMPFKGSNSALPELPTGNWADSGSPVTITVPSQSGRDSWRVIGESIVNNSSAASPTVNVILAVNLNDLNAATHRLQLFDLAVGGAIVIILAMIGAAVVRANLRPLNDIELTAGQIAKGHLDHRIPERDPRTEIGSLGHSLNAMLAQIEQAFHAREKSEQAAHESEERMRRFIADASHELRTPLTTIRGFAEYYRQRGGIKSSSTPSSSLTDGAYSASPAGSLAPADIDRIMQRLESEASRMGMLVEDLLQLARLDQQRPLDLGPVDLLTLAADAVQDSRMVAPDRPIELIIGRGGAFLVEGDEQRLRQVIGNLVNNARTHTPTGTPVRVKLSTGTLDGAEPEQHGAPAVVLDVEDDGPGITAEQAQHIFERFYRADAARNRASGGTGLGLAIVAGLVEAHGGTVSVTSAPGEGADFQVKLPLSPDALGDDEEEDNNDDDLPA